MNTIKYKPTTALFLAIRNRYNEIDDMLNIFVDKYVLLNVMTQIEHIFLTILTISTLTHLCIVSCF